MAASGTGVVKTTTQTVASVEKAKPDFEVTADADGLAKWSLDTEELGLPVQKPGHWSLGETVSTNLVAIRFFICVKLTIATPHNSLASSGSGSGSHWTVTEVALPAQEIQVVSISAARRAYVLAKVEQTKATRAASKSAPSSTTASPTGHLLPPSSSSPSSSSGRPTRRPRSSNTHSPLGSSAEREQQKSKSKKRLRGERDKDALPSPPPSPYEFRVQLPDAASSTSSTAPLLRGYQPATKLVIPPKVDGEDDEDVSMELPAVDSDESAEAEDDDGFFVIMSGDLNLQRMSNKLPSASTRSHRATSPRAAAAGSSKSKSGREAGGSKSKGTLKNFVPFKNSSRRPVTADVGRRSAEREMEVHQGYQRATSVGAVSPTGVLMLAERMGELMDLEEEEGHDHHHHRDDEDNPFSFSPPPPEASSSTSSLPDIHVQPPSSKSLSSSPASSVSTVTIRQSPVPASTSAARATMAMALLEKEWEEELMKMEAASRRGSMDMSSAGGDFAGQCRRRRTRTRELAAAEE
ncbi:hypothetical protein FRB90_003495 [Tulasnella sp. 427]|nr:hypothetical protein FRB90_003495 [Tulasnella sp. 427]